MTKIWEVRVFIQATYMSSRWKKVQTQLTGVFFYVVLSGLSLTFYRPGKWCNSSIIVICGKKQTIDPTGANPEREILDTVYETKKETLKKSVPGKKSP